MTDRICIAAIAGAFGVRGEVRLKAFTATPEDVAAYGAVTTEDAAQSFTITLSGQTTKGALIARLSGIATKEQAEALKGTRLYVDRTRLPNLPDDEYYHADLIGLEVYDTGGTLLGTVKSVLNHGASDILEVLVPGLPAPALLPFTLEAVPTVDLTTGRIIADPPDGVF
ncbi:ribosome maturation factor RimM [Roseovarius phycicola]|uniref:Ribosome maturation factor RimM n=1 Tax=Roseovarius phycicola TaxID=3080976 RepID=A0ABZ2HLJ2_9RHOB